MKKLFWFIATIVIGFKLACLIIDWQANIAYKKEIAKSTAAVTDISKTFKNVQFNNSEDKNQISNDEYQNTDRPSSKTTNKVPEVVSQLRFEAIRKEDEPEVQKLNEKLQRIISSVEEAKKVAQDENEDPYLRQVALFVLGWKKEKVPVAGVISLLKSDDIDAKRGAAVKAFCLGASGNLTEVERMWLLTALIEAFNYNRYRTKKRWVSDVIIVNIKMDIAAAICCVGYKLPSFDITPYVEYIIDRLDDKRFKDEPSVASLAARWLGDLGLLEAIPALKKVYRKYQKRGDESMCDEISYQIMRIRIKHLTKGKIDI